MSTNTIYLITGANRGIGLGLTTALLIRPNTTVIATARVEANTDALVALPTHATSMLILGALSSTSDTDAHSLASTLRTEHGIKKIDVVIANAGYGSTFLSVEKTPIDALREDFEVNCLGVVRLFQGVCSLLVGGQTGNEGNGGVEGDGKGNGEGVGEGKFVVVSSSLGSIGAMEGSTPSCSYGVAKAGANYVVRKVAFECVGLIAFAVHPGWVKTANGQRFADVMWVSEPPMSLEESVGGVLKLIDEATKETSGKFLSYDGSEIPW